MPRTQVNLSKKQALALRKYLLYVEGIAQNEGYDTGSKYTPDASDAFVKLDKLRIEEEERREKKKLGKLS